MTDRVPVTLCIINYNGATHLPGAFAALREQSSAFAEVLLIDNASGDDSLEIAGKLCPSLRVVRLDRNGGPAAARNVGLRAARNDRILFQDNDIRLGPDTAAKLIRHLDDHPDALVVAPRVLYEADPGVVQFDSADCHFLGLMHTRNSDRRLQDLDVAPAPTSSMVSACFLFNRRSWDGLLLFDESFGFNLEDHDFGVRARLAGHRLWVQPAAAVQHGSGTPGLSYRPGLIPSEERVFYLTRNRWILVCTCFSLSTLVLLSPALLAYEAMQLAWLASTGRVAAWWRAARSLVVRWPSILAKRRSVQSTRRVGDRSILRDAPLPLTSHARSHPLARWFAPLAEGALRGYWRLAQHWVHD